MSSSPRVARWVKSSFSGENGTCVELAVLGADRIGVRDSNHPGPAR